MGGQKIPKPQAERVRECMAIYRKLTEELGIPAENPSIRVFKKRMTAYMHSGEGQDEVLPIFGYDRSIHYKFPRWAHQQVDALLRVNRVMHPRLPADLQEELSAQTSSEKQSGP